MDPFNMRLQQAAGGMASLILVEWGEGRSLDIEDVAWLLRYVAVDICGPGGAFSDREDKEIVWGQLTSSEFSWRVYGRLVARKWSL